MTIEILDNAITAIFQSIVASESKIDALTADVQGEYKLSAKNLCRYLILRSYDLRHYHDSLSDLGLSSLRSSEGYVYNNLHNVVRNLRFIQGQSFESPSGLEFLGYQKSKNLVTENTNRLFKNTDEKRHTKIMVTLPDEAATDKSIIREMALNGMDIARINLSHGNQDQWTNMIQFIHEIEQETGKSIKIYMDLAGPKIRTSDIEVTGKKGKLKHSITIQKGERILLTKRDTPGKKSTFNQTNNQLERAEVAVELPEIIDDVRINDEVFFDDGMIRAVVTNKSEADVELLITECYKCKISAHKGINLPHTKLHLPALTEQDMANLPFVGRHADIVGYSFVRTAADVLILYEQLKKHTTRDIGVVFKIENKEAFENLPHILLEGMKHHRIGVMIARGDLAVEIGFERISEVQNEILWICEAAHIPVIWATQVLESLAKTGIPTRAEISDAAQGAYAECVMLNKGGHINDAIRTLKNILTRMESHQFKKKDALRALGVATKFVDECMQPIGYTT